MKRFFMWIMIISCAILINGCEDNKKINHTPASEMGALGIDNETSSDVDVFIDGAQYSHVSNGRTGVWDMEPGVYRLVINDDSGDRNYSGDIDIIVDYVTQVTITSSTTDYYHFDVVTDYHN